MNATQSKRTAKTAALLTVVGLVLLVPRVDAHCDSLDGPVILTARAALEKGDPGPLLKWVRASDEGEIKAAFARTLAVRTKGPDARELADRYFFETLVRVHRAGEGFPYTGLKGTVAEAGPAVVGADEALVTGSVDGLVKLVAGEATEGLRRRFAEARERKAHADESVDAGREYVAAYVDYVHYAEGLYAAASRRAGHHGESAAEAAPEPGHEHGGHAR